VFQLAGEEYGVPIEAVQEIVRVPEGLTRVPKVPAFMEGVVNLRGMVLPVVDQRRRFALEEAERNDRQRIMVLMIEGTRTGFIVDQVLEVLKIPRTTIEPAPTLSDAQARLIRRVANLERQKRMILLIDPAALLGAGELAQLEAL
jgi:purine-binding chemotaxis protein CheW